MRLPALLIAACLAGCGSGSSSRLSGALDVFKGSSTSELSRDLSAFQGKPVDEMIARFGEPTQQREVNGQRVLTWNAEERSFLEGYWLGFENDSTYEARCVITAQVREQTVVKVDHQGNLEDCKFLGLI